MRARIYLSSMNQGPFREVNPLDEIATNTPKPPGGGNTIEDRVRRSIERVLGPMADEKPTPAPSATGNTTEDRVRRAVERVGG